MERNQTVVVIESMIVELVSTLPEATSCGGGGTSGAVGGPGYPPVGASPGERCRGMMTDGSGPSRASRNDGLCMESGQRRVPRSPFKLRCDCPATSRRPIANSRPGSMLEAIPATSKPMRTRMADIYTLGAGNAHSHSHPVWKLPRAQTRRPTLDVRLRSSHNSQAGQGGVIPYPGPTTSSSLTTTSTMISTIPASSSAAGTRASARKTSSRSSAPI